jgi:hypothetical protein
LTIINGLLYVQTSDGNKLLTTPPSYNANNELLFCIEADGIISACLSQDNIRHTSLSFGRALSGVGILEVRNGKITKLRLDSGHYLPSITPNKQTVSILQQKGINLPETLPVTYFENFTEHQTTLTQF